MNFESLAALTVLSAGKSTKDFWDWKYFMENIFLLPFFVRFLYRFSYDIV